MLKKQFKQIENITDAEESHLFYSQGEQQAKTPELKAKLVMICNMLGNVSPKVGKYSLLIPYPLDKLTEAKKLYREFFPRSSEQQSQFTNHR